MLLFSHSVMSDSFVTPWTVASQGPLSTGFPRQEYWSVLPFPPPGDLADPGIEPVSPALAGRVFTAEALGKACIFIYLVPKGDLEKQGGEEPQQS